jgi:NAD(P)-dependent dehydrogenase (short-subunit alcohol dehydrogenase family)
MRAVALVTGGARGIGLAIASALARRGAALAIVDREAPKALDPPLQDAMVLAHDVRDFRAAAAAVDAIEKRLGPLSIAVLNAGISRDAASWNMTEEDWREVIDVNLTGAFAWARRARA